MTINAMDIYKTCLISKFNKQLTNGCRNKGFRSDESAA